MGAAANAKGLSRKHIMESVDASLKRTGLDDIDQLVILRHPHGRLGGTSEDGMDWGDTPEQAAFRAEVQQFIRERLPEHYR